MTTRVIATALIDLEGDDEPTSPEFLAILLRGQYPDAVGFMADDTMIKTGSVIVSIVKLDGEGKAVEAVGVWH